MDNTFDPAQEYILEDNYVLLRPLRKEDCNNLLCFSQNEPELWTYSLQKAAGKENLEQYIQITLDARAAGKEYPFIVFDKRSRQYAGSTRFYDIQPTCQSLQLGFTWYGKNFQGTGLNKHCKFLLLAFAFEKLNMERVEFRADHANKRSIAAMKSIGCKPEGILRSHMPKPGGGRRDSIILSILKEEWFNDTRENLRKRL